MANSFRIFFQKFWMEDYDWKPEFKEWLKLLGYLQRSLKTFGKYYAMITLKKIELSSCWNYFMILVIFQQLFGNSK